MNDIRAEFEKWHKENYCNYSYDTFMNGDYRHPKVDESWIAFQAGAALNAVSVGDGYVLVPIEPTKEMAIAGELASEKSHDETTDSYSTYSFWDDTKVAYACYKAMINAAIKPKGEPS